MVKSKPSVDERLFCPALDWKEGEKNGKFLECIVKANERVRNSWSLMIAESSI